MKILASVPAMQIMHVGERSLLAEAEEPLVWERALESMMTVRVGRKEERDPVSHTLDGFQSPIHSTQAIASKD